MGLLAIQALLAFGSIRSDSVTFDELTHFVSGLSYWRTNDFRMDPENPPFISLWSTMPLRFMNLPELPLESRAWFEGNQWQFARAWFGPRVDGERLLVYGRSMMTLLLLALSAMIYLIARQLMGRESALIALFCAVFWPTLIAHGRLVTSDVPLALFAMLTIWAFADLAARPSFRSSVLAAVALTGLVLVKFSAILVFPALLAILVLGVRQNRPLGIRACGLALLVGATAWAGVWTAYGWRFSMFADDVADLATIADEKDVRLDRRVFWQRVLTHTAEERNKPWVPLAITLAENSRLLPEAFLYGFTYTYHSAKGRNAFLAGEYRTSGWWCFFPLGFLLKTPLGTLLLLAFGTWATAARWRHGCSGVASGSDTSFNILLLVGLGVFAAIYSGSALTSAINLGERHIAPIYPAICVLCGGAATYLRTLAGRVLVTACALGTAASTILAFPNFIPYFNEAAGGTANGHRWLVDSSYDWGQDLHRLAAYARKYPDLPVKLAYFGSADPTHYLRCQSLLSYFEFLPKAKLEPGLYCYSPTQYRGVFDEILRPDFWDSPTRRSQLESLLNRRISAAGGNLTPASTATDVAELFEFGRMVRLLDRLRNRPPDARAGAMMIFRVDAAELERLTVESASNPTSR